MRVTGHGQMLFGSHGDLGFPACAQAMQAARLPPARRPQGTSVRLEIVRRPDDLHTFQVLPRRWVVERTLSWITRHRRTVRHYERLPAHHETYIYWAMIIVMTRRLARQPSAAQPAAT